MGRKSLKSKEKKQKRKEESMRLAVAQAKVDAANELADPLQMFPVFQKFERNGLNLNIACERISDMAEDLVDWAFELTKSNMQTLYETGGWGWKDKEKRAEMTEDMARYLIVTDSDNKLVGFVHFRFDIDYDEEVLYVYEIQLIKEVRRKGLGKFLLQILELMAHKTQMKKVIQTVFKQNTAGYDFYTKTMKYEVDETNPEEYVFEEGNSYVILSKAIKPRKVESSNTKGAIPSVAVSNGTPGVVTS
ncbi:N-alpha-acetyltransferase 40-like [Liolophura sinensis]|uniref:N-alpha-acetyltransferase 40-like n=1 Tax=Liolophura sinensis TaxID=3198878 RepID=UPI0031595303